MFIPEPVLAPNMAPGQAGARVISDMGHAVSAMPQNGRTRGMGLARKGLAGQVPRRYSLR
ncbi:MAG: hypothetical protein GC186_05515 [Rhodobacteraceae bacterium]|nr:hypothetical protein [Paracoccaceae bacterium]